MDRAIRSDEVVKVCMAAIEVLKVVDGMVGGNNL
jgi:hypothetical protein